MLIKHSFLYFLGRIIPGIVSLLALALYTRLLTAEQYGQYALVMAAVSIVNAVCFQWLSLSVGRFLPKHDNQAETLLSTTFISFFILVTITGLLGGAVACFWPDKNLRWFIVIALVIGWLQAWYDLNLKIINIRMLSIRYGVINSIKAVLTLVLGLGLFYLGLGVIGILLGLILGLLISAYFSRTHWRGISKQFYSKLMLKDFMSYGMPLTLTFLLTLTLDVSDRFLISWFLNTESVGTYAAAYDLTQQSLGMLMGVIHLAAFPLALRALEEKSEEHARNQLKQNLLILLMISIPATTALVILADNIAFVMLGTEFRVGASHIIMIIALAIFIAGIKSYYFDYSFQLRNKMQGLIWVTLFAAITNISLNLWCIPKYGLLGAAYATLAAFIIGLLVSWHLGRKLFRLPSFPNELYKIILASLAMGFGLYLTIEWRGSIYLSGQIVLGFAIYAVFLVTLNTSQSRLKIMRHLKWSH